VSHEQRTLTVMFISSVLALSLALPVAANTNRATTSTVAREHQSATQAKTSTVTRPKFAGHRPGRIYLGMSCGESCPQKESQLGTNIGLKRWFKQWGNWRGVAKALQEDRRKHRRSWISIEGPRGGAPAGWLDVGRGQYDRQIRQLATVLKHQHGRPVFLSFDHEMSNKAPDSQGRWWARGFNRFHDVLKRAHALKHVSLAPIHASWLFSRFNDQNPAKWLPPSVLRRTSFLAVDIYQNWKGESFGSRIRQVDRWLNRHGHPGMMIGVGETGATNGLGSQSAASWLNASLRWAARHRNTVTAISYFNSTAYSAPDVYWPLDESSNKISTYRSWLRKPVFINRIP
jgi:hypothetical protein